ncbi:MAG: hypothetical protein QOE61_210 [Micromonosporaceae bacterium]|nr:hypothetical protein [Micromonosporaceae bacterium]
MNLPSRTSVLIVGGGPVGLATAVELGTRGVDCVVLEPRVEPSTLRPRAKSSSVRTMEHFRRWGIADRIRELAGVPVAWSQESVVCTHLLGPRITGFTDCFGLAPQRRPEFAESSQQVPQPVVERVLRERVASLPSVTFAAGWKAESLKEYAEHVEVEAAGPDGAAHRITAAYAVGCDGSAGMTRTAIGAGLVGSSEGRTNLSVMFRSPGLAERVPHGPAVHYWVLNRISAGVFGRFDLADTWWAGVAADGDGEPADLLAALIGEPVDVEILSVDRWTARMQIADRYQTDRVFLAGDAAHLNPPWGGHGYNTGVGDAVNIGWKLAATVQEWGGPGLLRSYEAERRAVAELTIAYTTANMSAMRGVAAAAGSDPATFGTAVREAMDGEFHSLGLVLGYEYGTSPVVVDGSDASPPELGVYVPSSRPGARLPHLWLDDGRSLYDALGNGLTLLRIDPGDAGDPMVSAAARRGIPLTVVDLADADGPYSGESALLVRPDQHVAWRASSRAVAADAVLDRVLALAPKKFL